MIVLDSLKAKCRFWCLKFVNAGINRLNMLLLRNTKNSTKA